MSRIEKTNNVKPQPRDVKPKQTTNKHTNEPSIGKLLVNRAAALIMTPITATVGAIYVGGKSVEGLVTKKPYEKAMQEGIKDVSQGADMLDKTWSGKYF